MTEQCDQCRYFKLATMPKWDQERQQESWNRMLETSSMFSTSDKLAESLGASWSKQHVRLLEYYEKFPEKIDSGICRWERDNQPLVYRVDFCRHFEKIT